MVVSRTDFFSDSKCYRGEAEKGSLDIEAKWKIKLTEITGEGEVITLFANGYQNYDNVWDDRGSLAYRKHA